MKTVKIGKFHILELIISGFMDVWYMPMCIMSVDIVVFLHFLNYTWRTLICILIAFAVGK